MRGFDRGFGTAPGADDPDLPDGTAGAVGSASPADAGPDGSPDRELAGPATAEDVKALIEGISRLRLAASTDLSAAAGAMDAGRPEVAAELVAGTQVDLARLNHSFLRREQEATERELVSAGVGGRVAGHAGGIADADSSSSPGANEARNRPAPLRHPGRILAGVALLAVTLLMAPRLDGGAGSAGNATATAAARSQSPQIRLVSAEFQALQSALRSPDATAAAVLEAGKNWQRAVSQSLSAASTHVQTASQLVLLLRQERTLISDAGQQSPALSEATQTLAGGSDTLLDTLRGMAEGPVLEALPTAITVLPSQPSGGTSTAATNPSTGETTSPATPTPGGSASPAPEPTAGTTPTPVTTPTPSTPAQPTPPAPSSPAPTPSPTAVTTPTPSPSLPLTSPSQLQTPQTRVSVGVSVGKASTSTVTPSVETGSGG